MQPEAISRLIAEFRKFPSVGQKTAMRYAYSVIEKTDAEAQDFIDAIKSAKEEIHFCKLCGDYTDGEICERCQSAEKSTICVVKEPRDILAFEKMGSYDGLFHVLHGSLDFKKGVGADNIRIKELLERLGAGNVKEVVIALNPDISGEITANYIAQLIKPLGVKVTRLAHGIPIGSEIEYADELTLSRALSDRKEI